MMSVFQVGDIVECLKDRPYGADIGKGSLAIIVKCNEYGHIRFRNYPKHRDGIGTWSGSADDFILDSPISLENE